MSDLIIKKTKKQKPVLIYVLLVLLGVFIVYYAFSVGKTNIELPKTAKSSANSQEAPVSTTTDAELIESQRQIDEEFKKNPPPLPCTETSKIMCRMDFDDAILTALNMDIKKNGVTLNGTQVYPKAMYYQLHFIKYQEDTVLDTKREVIASNKKKFQDGNLTILLGIPKNYYNALGAKDRRDLYLTQLVRAFLTLNNESSEDYAKISAVTVGLEKWQPSIAY